MKQFKNQMSNLTNYNIKINESHPFHLVKPSPWPFMTSLATLLFLLSFVVYFIYSDFSWSLIFLIASILIFMKRFKGYATYDKALLPLPIVESNSTVDVNSTPCLFFGWKLIIMIAILIVSVLALAFWFFKNPQAAYGKITADPVGRWLLRKFRAILFTYQLFLLTIVSNIIIITGWQNFYWLEIMLLGIPGTIIVYYFLQRHIDYLYMRMFIWFSGIYSKLLDFQDTHASWEVNASVLLFAISYTTLFLIVIRRILGDMNSLATLLLFSIFLLMAIFLLIIRRYILPIHHLSQKYPDEDLEVVVLHLFGIDDIPGGDGGGKFSNLLNEVSKGLKKAWHYGQKEPFPDGSMGRNLRWALTKAPYGMRFNAVTSVCIVVASAAGVTLKCVDTIANHRTSIAVQHTSIKNGQAVDIHNRLLVDKYRREAGLSHAEVLHLTGIDLSKPAPRIGPSSYAYQAALPDINNGTTDIPSTVDSVNLSAITTPTTAVVTGGEFGSKVSK